MFDGLNELDVESGSDTLAVWNALKASDGQEDAVRAVFARVEGP